MMPVERLVNIDTGVEKLKLAFHKGEERRWREIIVEKSVLASNQKILQLSDQGIAVTSENARALVRYISDMENINYDIIPQRKSVSRLGYIPGEGFSPYVDGLIFDGDANFKHLFQAVTSHGRRELWYETAKEIRRGSVMARVMLAASFASVLVQPCGALPLFCAPVGRRIGHRQNGGFDAGRQRVGQPGAGAVHPNVQQHRGGP